MPTSREDQIRNALHAVRRRLEETPMLDEGHYGDVSIGFTIKNGAIVSQRFATEETEKISEEIPRERNARR